MVFYLRLVELSMNLGIIVDKVDKEVKLVENWTQEVLELIPTQESDLSQLKAQESRLVQEVGPNQEVETQDHIPFPTMECDLILVIQVQE